MKRLLSCLMIAVLFCVFPYALSEGARSHSIFRLDEEGYLYYMDYTMDYYGPEVMNALKEGGFIDTGCSAFFTHDPEGNPITCRNYDYPHRVSQEDQTLTGLNVVLHCKPEGKYESIGMADAVWYDEQNQLLQKGGPDLPGFDIHLLDILPYNCMDGPFSGSISSLVNNLPGCQLDPACSCGICWTIARMFRRQSGKSIRPSLFRRIGKTATFL